MKLKCWIGNLDGSRNGLIISTSKEKARKVIGRCSRAEFDGYWVLQEHFSMVGLSALFKPDTLYTSPIDPHGKDVREWIEGLCPLSKSLKLK